MSATIGCSKMNANPLEAQAHIMHQTNALRDTLTDQFEWEKEIKELEKKRKTDSENKKHQPVRSHGKSSNGPSISNGHAGKSIDIIKSPAHLAADELKSKGNDCVKQGDFKKAICFYTEAIRSYKFDAAFFTNRALCYLKLKQYIDCIEDCSIAIQLDPVCVKAFYRRMQANENLANIDDALSDCRKVLQLDANNKDAKRSEAALAEKRKRMAKAKPAPKKQQNYQPNFTIREATATQSQPKVATTTASRAQWSKFNEPGDIRIDFFDRPPHLRPQQSLHNIAIREVEQLADVREKTPTIVDIQPAKSSRANSNNVQLEDSNEASATASGTNQATIHIEEISSDKTGNEHVNATKKIEIVKASSQEPPVVIAPKSPFTVTTENPSVRKIATPNTTTEFHMAWASMACDEERYSLLKKTSGRDFNKLLGAQFTSTMLSEVLLILNQRFVNDKLAIGSIMKGIVTNSEMKIFAFMMSNEEKLVFAQLITYMRSMGENEELVNFIEQKFNSILS